MIDREDRELLVAWAVVWGVKGLGIALAILSLALVCGASWRLFDLVRG